MKYVASYATKTVILAKLRTNIHTLAIQLHGLFLTCYHHVYIEINNAIWQFMWLQIISLCLCVGQMGAAGSRYLELGMAISGCMHGDMLLGKVNDQYWIFIRIYCEHVSSWWTKYVGYPTGSFCQQTTATITEVVKEVLTNLKAGNKTNDEVTVWHRLMWRVGNLRTGISLAMHVARWHGGVRWRMSPYYRRTRIWILGCLMVATELRR